MSLTATSEAVASRLQLNGQEYCFVRAQDQSRILVVDPNNEIICGGYAHRGERVRPGPRLIRLHTLLYPTPTAWNTLLPLIGYTESDDVFSPTNSLTTFSAQVDYDLGGTGNYRNGKVDRAIARGQQGLNPVSLELQMVFEDFDMDAEFSASSPDIDFSYEFTSGTLSLGSTGVPERKFASFVWVRDNHLRSRLNNETTPTNIATTQRTIHLGISTPFTTDESDLLTDPLDDATRIAGQVGSLLFSVSPQSLQFEFPQLVWTEAKPPDIERKDAEIRIDQYYKAFQSGSTDDCTITNILSA